MKRVGCIISVLLFLFTVSQSTAETIGDVTGDARVGISDAIAALQVL